MISEEQDFRGIYMIDTRSFRIVELSNLPERLYILDSKPLTRNKLLQFLSIIEERTKEFTMDRTLNVSDEYWPLKYVYIIWNKGDRYYILNRYLKKIRWEKILTV